MTKTSKAPEQIWVDYSPHTESYGHISDEDDGGYTSYTRTDTIPAQLAEARNAALRGVASSDELIDKAVWALLEYGVGQSQSAKSNPDLNWKIERAWTLNVVRKQMRKAILALIDQPAPGDSALEDKTDE